MIDIDWSKAPEGATHYNASGDHYPWERRYGDALSYVGHDGKWHELSEGGTFEWPDAIPRPAKHRDWSDEAMWFDAPDWAASVSKLSNGEIIYTSGGRIYKFVGSDDVCSFGGQGCFMIDDARLIATRPSQKQTIDDLLDGVTPEIFTGDNDAFNEGAGNTLGAGEDSQQAPDFLRKAAQHMEDRAIQRDSEDGERSMGRTVSAFNHIYGKDLTEEMGWQFMVLLKMSRSSQGKYTQDDYEDEAAYSALAGEAAKRDRT